MRFHRNLKTAVALLTIYLLLIWIVAAPVFAIEPHEDPEAAEELFSGVSLFWYLDDVMDSVLLLDVTEVEALLGKMHFTNIPRDLDLAMSDFALSGIDLSRLLSQIDVDVGELITLASQFRLPESLQQATGILIALTTAEGDLGQMERSTDVCAEVSGVSLAPILSNLRRAYEEVLQRLVATREVLAGYEEELTVVLESLDINLEELLDLAGTDLMELLESLDINLEKLLESLDINLEKLLKPTEITLEVRPSAAFVSDSIHFQGVLTSGNELLGERGIDVQVDGSRHTTVRTDSQGRYEGVLSVPYRYVLELGLRTLYYPRGGDVGRYLASLSPLVKLEVLFHEAKLELYIADEAYPGRETTVAGRFDYGDTAPPAERDIEVYLDDILIFEAVVDGTFSQRIELPADTVTGQHTITISASGKGRYAPVVASATLNVVRAILVLDSNLPRVVMIPGSIGLLGTLRSEVGQLNGALLTFELDRSRVEAVSTAVGDFDTRLSMGMNLALVGSQNLRINIVPQEPWHAPLAIVQQVLVVNVVNIGGLLILLVVMGVYLPGRLKGRFGVFVRRAPSPVIRSPQPVSTPSYSTEVEALVPVPEGDESSQAPESRILNWYRMVVRLLQRMTRVLLRPQQTLREFATECGGVLGPAAGYFTELTRIVEKVLYSKHKPTREDAERSRHLSNTIEEVFRREDV